MLLEFIRPTRFWGCCDEIRLSVEFVTVGFLRICGIHVVIDSRGYGDGVLAC